MAAELFKPFVIRKLIERGIVKTVKSAKKIVDRFIEQGVPVKGLIGLGGVAKKSPFIMQMMSDVMNMPIRIHKSEQTCAAGAAMFAATAAGIYDKVEDAMSAMGQGFDAYYEPNPAKAELYKKLPKHFNSFIKSLVEIERQVACAKTRLFCECQLLLPVFHCGLCSGS